MTLENQHQKNEETHSFFEKKRTLLLGYQQMIPPRDNAKKEV
jgi:hypothetical protein